MAQIVINNKTVIGKSISILNNRVIVDGKSVELEESKVINISVEGDVENLSVDVCETVKVTGNVKKLSTVSGDVDCGHVEGNVETTSGEVICGDVNGSVKTMSGDVVASVVKGSVNTLSGDITKK